MLRIQREVRDWKRLSRGREDVIFYSEGRNYYPNFEGLIPRLDSPHYITSDWGDPVLLEADTYYLSKLLPFYMASADCKVFVMTMTDLNSFHIKRSTRQVHYVYIFHALASTHMVYRYGAFDHYDSILCAGPHQAREIREHEKLHGLKPKNLIETGYYGVERLYKAYESYERKDRKVTVLVAPTWGPSNLLEVCGEEFLRILHQENYRITLRLHPETVKKRKFPSYGNAPVETSVVSVDSLLEADVLITEWSAVGLEYAFGTERPVIFIDTPPKIRNSKYKELGIEPIESHLRDKIGVVVPLSELDSIPHVIASLLSQRHSYKSSIQKLRSEYVFNFGRSSEVGADYIRSLL